MQYTVGNWTIDSHEVDTIAQTKNLAVVDLDYVHDFSVSPDGTSQDVRLINTSGTALEPVEKLRYAKERVADIYRNASISKVAQLPSPVGTRVLAENQELLSATNSVSGQELTVPIRIWTCIESSTHNVITGDALLWALKRHIGMLLGTGSVSSEQIIKLFRGDLDPTK
jgi:gamma-glutamyl phosphate reductase